MKHSNIGIVIQARMGSTRLPGKSLLPVFGDMPLAGMVFARALSATLPDKVILATSRESNCDPLAALGDRMGLEVIRGPEDDVLARFTQAVRQFNLAHVVRICADNPLVSGEEIDNLVRFHLDRGADYSRNNTPASGLPDGLGCEIIRASLLLDAEPDADAASREHVTAFVSDRPAGFTTAELVAPESLHCPNARLDIDTAEDLERMRTFIAGLPPEEGPLWSTARIVDHARKTGLCGGEA
ncbi:cytidylyltransferase domain-containing protein [Pseudodesulfovibrio sp.]|uniref:cytidylyltransferase domain-containing protein n=1 Tax=unclassified Pseudodesulfovibrio TaxID=2661612 RepID=UPI003B002940